MFKYFTCAGKLARDPSPPPPSHASSRIGVEKSCHFKCCSAGDFRMRREWQRLEGLMVRKNCAQRGIVWRRLVHVKFVPWRESLFSLDAISPRRTTLCPTAAALRIPERHSLSRARACMCVCILCMRPSNLFPLPFRCANTARQLTGASRLTTHRFAWVSVMRDGKSRGRFLFHRYVVCRNICRYNRAHDILYLSRRGESAYMAERMALLTLNWESDF